MSAASIDADEQYLQNEFTKWSYFMKGFLKQKSATHQSETRALRSQIEVLKNQLRTRKTSCNRCGRLARENGVLRKKCVEYEKQIAKLAVNQRNNNDLVSNASNNNTGVAVVESKPCDSSTSVAVLIDINDGIIVENAGAIWQNPLELQVIPENPKPVVSGTAEGQNDKLTDQKMEDDDDDVVILEPDDPLTKKIDEIDIDVVMCKWMNPDEVNVMIRCSQMFTNRAELAAHVNEHVAEAKSYNFWCTWENCKMFAEPQQRKPKLMDHICEHTGEKPFVCPHQVCQKVFATYSSLLKHACAENKFPCSFPACPKVYRYKGARDKHYQCAHKGSGGKTPAAGPNPNTNPSSAKAHVCTVTGCSRRFRQKLALNYHLRTALHGSNSPPANKRAKRT